MKNARPPEGKPSAPEQGNSKSPASFSGTDNLRQLRVIQALLTRPQPREHLDQVAGCSNGPQLVADLRGRGLEIPCTRTKKQDRDMFDCWPGIYHFTQADRRKVNVWKRERASKGRT